MQNSIVNSNTPRWTYKICATYCACFAPLVLRITFNFVDVPVLSANSDPKLVMKGITHGACDYLVKPVRIEELRNIWQHVIRRKKCEAKYENKSTLKDKTHQGNGEGGQGPSPTDNPDQNGRINRKRKDEEEEEEEEGEGEGEGEENGSEKEDPGTQKKPRVVWSIELHRKFVAAVNQLGIESESFSTNSKF